MLWMVSCVFRTSFSTRGCVRLHFIPRLDWIPYSHLGKVRIDVIISLYVDTLFGRQTELPTFPEHETLRIMLCFEPNFFGEVPQHLLKARDWNLELSHSYS